MSTPRRDLGRSEMCPLEESTSIFPASSRPIVRALVGDSTIKRSYPVRSALSGAAFPFARETIPAPPGTPAGASATADCKLGTADSRLGRAFFFVSLCLCGESPGCFCSGLALVSWCLCGKTPTFRPALGLAFAFTVFFGILRVG
jgi:hypothetical protein